MSTIEQVFLNSDTFAKDAFNSIRGKTPHFPHGKCFACIVCTMQRITPTMLSDVKHKASEESTAKETNKPLQELFNKRTLGDTEKLLLLAASAYTTSLSGKTPRTYLFYYWLSAKLLPGGFKRFESDTSYRKLRRRLTVLEKQYGASNAVLRVASKFPFASLASRSSMILQVLQSCHEEPSFEVAKVLDSSPNEAELASKSGGASQRPFTGIKRKHVANALARDKPESERSSTKRHVPIASIHSAQSKSLATLMSSNSRMEVAGQEYRTMYATALNGWIPKLRNASDEEAEGYLRMLKPIFVMSLRMGSASESQQLLNGILSNLDKQNKEYQRFVAFQGIIAPTTSSVKGENDLYQRLVVNLSDLDRQVCLSLKFESLVKYGRWAAAKDLVHAFKIPKFLESVHTWIRMLECSIRFSLLYSNKEAIRETLYEQLEEISRVKIVRDSSTALSSVIKQIVSIVKGSYPIHSGFLRSILALLVVVVLSFEGRTSANKLRIWLSQAGFNVPEMDYFVQVQHCAHSCFEAGNLALALELYEELIRQNEATWDVWMAVGQLETVAGNHDVAEDHLCRAVQEAQKNLGKASTYAWALLFAANLHFLRGYFATPERLYIEALRVFEEDRNLVGVVTAKSCYACLLRRMGSVELSKNLNLSCLDALPHLRGKDARSQVSIVYTSLSADYYLQDNMGEADKYHRKCVANILDQRIGEGYPGRDMFNSCMTYHEWVVAGMLGPEKFRQETKDQLLYHLYPHPADLQILAMHGKENHSALVGRWIELGTGSSALNK